MRAKKSPQILPTVGKPMKIFILPTMQKPSRDPKQDPKYIKTRGRDPKYIKTRDRDPKYIKASYGTVMGGALVQDL